MLEKFKRWSIRGGTAILFLLFMLHVLEAFHLLDLVHIPFAGKLPPIGDLFSYASFFLLFYVWESAESRKEKFAEVEETLSEVKRRTEELSALHKTSTGIARYSGREELTLRCQKLFLRFSKIMMIGDPPDDYLAQFQQARRMGSSVSIYRPMEARSQSEIMSLIALAEDAASGISLYDIYPLGSIFVIVGSDQRGEETELLINFLNPSDTVYTGLHLRGEAAIAVSASLHAALVELPRGTKFGFGPARVWGKGDADWIVVKRTLEQREFSQRGLGIQKKGDAEICNTMASLLRGTRNTLKVTHVADEKSIALLKQDCFQDWIKENYAATKRGVKIQRIFIVSKKDSVNPDLVSVMKEMRAHDIEIRIAYTEDIPPELKDDFSVYDGAHVVYISGDRGSWQGQTVARSSQDRTQIELFTRTFEMLLGFSEEWG